MTDPGQNIWTEETAITRTPRENILLFLYQEGETPARDIRKELYLHRESAGRDFKYLTEHDFVEESIHGRSMSAHYQLSEKGNEFVEDKLLGGNPPRGP